MGYGIFVAGIARQQALVSLFTRQLDEIVNEKANLVAFIGNISDGMITADELSDDPVNTQNYLKFFSDAQNYRNGSGTSENMRAMAAQEQRNKEYIELLEENLNKALDREYARDVAKKLSARECLLDQKQKVIEAKLTAAQNQLRTMQEALGPAIQESTPKYAGLRG